jgi:hypothetical protein
MDVTSSADPPRGNAHATCFANGRFWRAKPDIQAAYLGDGHNVDYTAVKHYRQRRRWLS